MEAGEIVTGRISGKVKGGFTVDIRDVRALPARFPGRRAPRARSRLPGRQGTRVQDHQARPQAQQRRRLPPCGGREREQRRARADARAPAGRRDRQGRGQEPHRLRRVRGPRRHRRPAAHHRHGLEARAPSVRSRQRRRRTARSACSSTTASATAFRLGLKQLGEDPWDNIARRYPTGARLFGKVSNVTDYGAFVEIEPGVEGLVHVSEMDWTNKNVNPSQGRAARRRRRSHGAGRRRRASPHLAGHQAVRLQSVGSLRRHLQEGRQGFRPDQVDHRLRHLHRPGRRHRRPGAPVRHQLEHHRRRHRPQLQEGRHAGSRRAGRGPGARAHLARRQADGAGSDRHVHGHHAEGRHRHRHREGSGRQGRDDRARRRHRGLCRAPATSPRSASRTPPST